jgi:hypothetical protein
LEHSYSEHAATSVYITCSDLQPKKHNLLIDKEIGKKPARGDKGRHGFFTSSERNKQGRKYKQKMQNEKITIHRETFYNKIEFLAIDVKPARFVYSFFAICYTIPKKINS